MTRKKKIYRHETRTTINSETGEIIQESDIKKSMIEQEPPFIKTYVDDILRLKDVPKASNDVLTILLQNMSYGNVVVVISPIKRIICKATGLKQNTVNKAIQNLHKAGILIRKERSVYIVDPNLFAKGKWEDIKKLRLVIDYKPDGSKSINSNMVEQLKLDM
jgi:DNA primase catalytic subunit